MSFSMLLIASLLLALLSLPALAFLLYLFFRVNPPRLEPVLLSEDGTPYREKWFTPAFVGILVLYVLLGLLPYLLP